MKISQLDGKFCIGTGFLAMDIVVGRGESQPSNIAAGGTCANVLSYLAAFGWEARPIARIGDDTAGLLLVEDLRSAGVSTEGLIKSPSVQTPVIVHRYGLGSADEPKHRFEWNCPTCGRHLPRFRPTPIPIVNGAMPEGAPTVCFLDRATPGSLVMAREAKARGAIVYFEPPRIVDDACMDRCLDIADIVKVASDTCQSELDQRLKKVPLLIETLGSRGLRYRLRGFLGLYQDWFLKTSYPTTNLVDSCGSGDWLSAGFIHALLGIDGASSLSDRIDAALSFGQALATLNCEHVGARALLAAYRREEIVELAAMVMAEGASAARRETSSMDLQSAGSACEICGTGSVVLL